MRSFITYAICCENQNKVGKEFVAIEFKDKGWVWTSWIPRKSGAEEQRNSRLLSLWERDHQETLYKQMMSTWKHQSLRIHFHVGLGTKALTEQVPFLSQIAGWTPLSWCVPTTRSFGRAWQRLVSAKAQQAPSWGFGDAAPSLTRVVLDRFL